MTIKSSCFKRDLIVNRNFQGGNEFLFIQDLQVLYYIVQIPVVPIMTAIKLICFLLCFFFWSNMSRFAGTSVREGKKNP